MKIAFGSLSDLLDEAELRKIKDIYLHQMEETANYPPPRGPHVLFSLCATAYTLEENEPIVLEWFAKIGEIPISLEGDVSAHQKRVMEAIEVSSETIEGRGMHTRRGICTMVAGARIVVPYDEPIRLGVISR